MFPFLRLLTLCVLLTSSLLSGATISKYPFPKKDTVPDYFNLNNWAALPWKKDPSDSLPRALKKQLQDTLIDVFFIHPTTYTDAKTNWNASVNDSLLNHKTDYSTILYQASAFNQHARIFSPRYRQAHLSAFFADNDSTRAAFDTAYTDVRSAFLVYLKNYNHSRPLIIAGHSQGSKMAERLLKEFFDGKPLQQLLVAAYIIGWPIPQNYFDFLPVCRDAQQTGCFCGWRTFRKNYIPPYIQLETSTSYVTNPLNWMTTSLQVGRGMNKGSVLKDFNKIVTHTTDAQVHEGVLWVNRPKFPGSVFYNTLNYHIADINLFYINLRENVQERIVSYLKTH